MDYYCPLVSEVWTSAQVIRGFTNEGPIYLQHIVAPYYNNHHPGLVKRDELHAKMYPFCTSSVLNTFLARSPFQCHHTGNRQSMLQHGLVSSVATMVGGGWGGWGCVVAAEVGVGWVGG